MREARRATLEKKCLKVLESYMGCLAGEYAEQETFNIIIFFISLIITKSTSKFPKVQSLINKFDLIYN